MLHSPPSLMPDEKPRELSAFKISQYRHDNNPLPNVMDKEYRTISITKRRVLSLCLFAGSAVLLLWHFMKVSDFEPYELMRAIVSPHCKDNSTRPMTRNTDIDNEGYKVPLEAHIMSKSPNALQCLRNLVVPALAQTIDKVNFTLSYIATPTEDGMSCLHGPGECLGNILEICAQHHYPDPKIYTGFTFCLSKRYDEIPAREFVEECALEHGISFEKLNDCASKEDGAFGLGLLRKSVDRSKAVGVDFSCTVRLEEQVRCIADDQEGSGWRNCSRGSAVGDLVRDIQSAYEAGNKKVLDGW